MDNRNPLITFDPSRVVVVVLGLAAVFLISEALWPGQPRESPMVGADKYPPTETATRASDLHVNALHCRSSPIALYGEGEVKNTSDRVLESVSAVTSWYAKDNSFLRSERGYLSLTSLSPGQTTPFSVHGEPSASGIGRCKVQFTVNYGEPLTASGTTEATADP